MNKLYTIALAALLTPAIAMADASDSQYFDNYAAYQGTSTHSGSRGCSKLTVTDDLGNSLEITGPGHASHTIYTDATASVLTTQPGATLTFAGTSTNAEWMHNYVYIDFGNDGRFDVELENTDLNGDLVAFTGYCLDMKSDNSDTADPTLQSDGSATNNGNYWVMPTVTLPTDLKPGTYRVRLKNDWNSNHPYGRTNDTSVGGMALNNAIATNGGYIIDFCITIEGEEESPIEFNLQGIFANIEVYADADLTNLVMKTTGSEDGDEYTINESEITDGLYIKVLPDEGYELSQLIFDGEDYASEVIDGVFHIDLDQIEYEPAFGAINIIAVCQQAVKTYNLWIFGEKGPIAIYTDAELTNQLAYDNNSEDGQDLEITSNDIENGLYVVTYATDQLELKSLWINGYNYVNEVVDNMLYIADPTSLTAFDERGIEVAATYEEIELSGIEEVAVDLNAADAEYFNLQGVRVAAEDLNSGLYIVRQGDKTAKVVIKK